MEKEINPNHKIEQKLNKASESEHTLVDNSKLNEQDVNENFINLKNELIFYQDKSKKDEIRANLDDTIHFLTIKTEVEPDELIARGLDFAIIADVSESMYPYRIFLKKSMYYAIKDIENFVYKNIGNAEEFPKVRFAFVKYTDRVEEKEPCKVDVLDFIEYSSSLEEFCKKIDEIDIKAASTKKRAVLDGINALKGLSWSEDSVKIILHYAADPEYGTQYTANISKMGDNYDPFPSGVGLKLDDVLEPIEGLGSLYNLIYFNERLVRFISTMESKLTLDKAKPQVTEV